MAKSPDSADVFITRGQWWEDAGYEFEVQSVEQGRVLVSYADGREQYEPIEHFRDGTFQRA